MGIQVSNTPKIALCISQNEAGETISTLRLHNCFLFDGDDEAILHWLTNYAKGIHLPSPISPPPSPPHFQQKVWRALAEIPIGKTLSYSELAKRCGNEKAARAAGTACGNNRLPLFIPCHRIIQKNGGLGGFALDLEVKRRLLEFEGAYRS